MCHCIILYGYTGPCEVIIDLVLSSDVVISILFIFGIDDEIYRREIVERGKNNFIFKPNEHPRMLFTNLYL
jgi:hypothetical protein